MQWIPPLGPTDALWTYASIAIVMVAAEIYLLVQVLPRAGPSPTVTRMVIGTSALVGSAAFLLCLVYLVLFPNSATSWIIVLMGLNFMMFVPPGLWFIALIVYHDARIEPRSWGWAALVSGSATASEIVMGVLFSLPLATPALTPAVLANGLVSPWLGWPMATLMIALLCWLPLSRPAREGLAALALAGVVLPWVAASPLVGAVLMAGLMTIALWRVYIHLRNPARLSAPDARLLLLVVLAFVVMAVAEGANLAVGGTVGLYLLGVPAAAIMAVELLYLARSALAGARPMEPTLEPAKRIEPSVDSS